MAPHRPWLRFTELCGGFLIWGAQFGLVYMAVSVACGRGLSAARWLGLPAVLLLVTVVTLLALAGAGALLAVALRRRAASGAAGTDRFLADATAWGAALSLAAILFTGLPAFLAPACP